MTLCVPFGSRTLTLALLSVEAVSVWRWPSTEMEALAGLMPVAFSPAGSWNSAVSVRRFVFSYGVPSTASSAAPAFTASMTGFSRSSTVSP